MLKVLVLGSGAGGGSPQWNCNSDVSKAVRKKEKGTSPRTQSSIVVTANNDEWFLFNASPDLGSQILNNKQYFFIYLLNEGELIFPNGINVILNINEFSDSSSESL